MNTEALIDALFTEQNNRQASIEMFSALVNNLDEDNKVTDNGFKMLEKRFGDVDPEYRGLVFNMFCELLDVYGIPYDLNTFNYESRDENTIN